MAETLLSPGVLTRENDQSLVTQGPVVAGLAVLGPTVKGPVNVPTVVTSYSDYINRFGGSFTSASIKYEYLTNISVNNYFQQGGETAIVTRIVSGGFAPASTDVRAIMHADSASFTLETLSEGAIMNNSGSVLTIVQTNTLDGYISVGDDEFTLNGNPITNLRGVFTDTDGIMGVSGNKYIITFTNGVVTSINSFDDLGACPTTTTTTLAPTTTTTTTLDPLIQPGGYRLEVKNNSSIDIVSLSIKETAITSAVSVNLDGSVGDTLPLTNGQTGYQVSNGLDVPYNGTLSRFIYQFDSAFDHQYRVGWYDYASEVMVYGVWVDRFNSDSLEFSFQAGSDKKIFITFRNMPVVPTTTTTTTAEPTTTTTTAAPTTTTTTTLAPYSLFATSNNLTAGEQVEYVVLTNGIADGTSVYLNIDEGFDVITNANMVTTATLTISSGQANYFHTFNSNLEYNLFFDGDRVVSASLSSLDSNLANTGSPSYDINVLQTTNINVVGQVNGNNVNGLGYDYSDFVSVMCGTFNSISWDFIKTTGSQSMVVGDIVLDSQNQRLVNHVGAIYGGTGSSLNASSYYVFETNSNGEVSSLTQVDCSTLTTTTTII